MHAIRWWFLQWVHVCSSFRSWFVFYFYLRELIPHSNWFSHGPAWRKREDDNQGQLSRHKLLLNFTLFLLYFVHSLFCLYQLQPSRPNKCWQSSVLVNHRPSISLFHMLQLCVFSHSILNFSLITTVCLHSDPFRHQHDAVSGRKTWSFGLNYQFWLEFFLRSLKNIQWCQASKSQRKNQHIVYVWQVLIWPYL